MSWARIACWTELPSSLRSRSCTNKVIDDDFLQNEGKLLALPWGWTSRLDSGVRRSIILGFPSISLVIVSGQSGTLIGQGSVVIVTADADTLPQTLAVSRMVYGSGP
ncbi:hypothetical protein Tco_0413548 [Tanacetum coccineum]